MNRAPNDRVQKHSSVISDPVAHQVEAQQSDIIWRLCWHKRKRDARAAAQQRECGTAKARLRQQTMAGEIFSQQRPGLHSVQSYLWTLCLA